MQVYVPDRGEKLYRRSLYTIAKRTSPHPAMTAFDAPNREMCTVQRGVTNTPMQALVTLNDPQFAEAARVMAERWLDDAEFEESTTQSRRIELAFEHVTGRLPTKREADVLLTLLRSERRRYADDPPAAGSTIAVGQHPLPDDLDPVQHAAWTQVASVLLNLSESLTRN